MKKLMVIVALLLITDVTQKDKKKKLYIEKEQSGEFQWTKPFWTCTAIIY
jgi:hypothetical protein